MNQRKKSIFHRHRKTPQDPCAEKKEAFINWKLDFLDNNVEKSYKNQKKVYQTVYLKFFIIFQVLITMTSWFLFPTRKIAVQDPIKLGFYLPNLLLMAILYFALHKSKQFSQPQYGILFLQIYTSIVLNEVRRLYLEDLAPTNKGLEGMLIEFLILIPMICKCDWILTSLSAFLLSNYFNVRYTCLEDNVKLFGYPALFYTLNSLFVLFGSYYNEKLDKLMFFMSSKNENNLTYFENIIKNAFPCSVIIFDAGKIVFANKESFRLLACNLKSEIEDRLRFFWLNNAKTDSPRNNESMKRDSENFLFTEDTENSWQSFYEFLIGKPFLTASSQSQSQSFIGRINYNELGGKNEDIYFDVKINSLLWEGSEAVIVIISEDDISIKIKSISDQVKYKDQILATVSHDLRTPLNGVIGILEMTLEDIKDPKQRENLMLALRSSQLLLYMINDILDMSLIANGKLRLNPTEFCAAKITKEVIELIKFQARKKGVELLFESRFSNSANVYLRSDSNRLKQVLLNLLSNALKFTREGFIKIIIEPGVDKRKSLGLEKNFFLEDTQPVKFTVQDTGCGIKSEDIPRLFRVFGKIDNSVSQEINPVGIGLGLSISQTLVKYLNQEREGEVIRVTSEWGKGSSFTFEVNHYKEERTLDLEGITCEREFTTNIEEGSLKRIPPDMAKKSLSDLIYNFEEGDNIMEVQRNKRIRVLLVDDDQINIMVLSKYLETYSDIEYEIAFNGLEAVNKIITKASKQEYFDTIIMDCNMPVMNGLEATRVIIGMVKEKKIPDLSIIASTANASQGDYEKCSQAGMVDYITKPFSRVLLREKLDNAMKRS